MRYTQELIDVGVLTLWMLLVLRVHVRRHLASLANLMNRAKREYLDGRQACIEGKAPYRTNEFMTSMVIA